MRSLLSSPHSQKLLEHAVLKGAGKTGAVKRQNPRPWPQHARALLDVGTEHQNKPKTGSCPLPWGDLRRKKGERTRHERSPIRRGTRQRNKSKPQMDCGHFKRDIPPGGENNTTLTRGGKGGIVI